MDFKLFGTSTVNRLSISSDGVVGINNQSLGENILTIKVGTLLIIHLPSVTNLITNTVGNVGGEQTPLVSTSKLLGSQAESTNLFLRPIPLPLLQIYHSLPQRNSNPTGFHMTIEVGIRVRLESTTTTLLCRVLSMRLI